MWAVAMATTAAPTFFPAFRLPEDHVRLIDGGVWANNPAMAGVTEAVSLFCRPLDEDPGTKCRHHDQHAHETRQPGQRRPCALGAKS